MVGHTSDVWALSPSPEGKLLASSSSDQTIRLWAPETGHLLVSVFIASNDEWVAWTPQGYYTASPEGESLIGWHINNGVDKQAEYYPISQFRRQYYWTDFVNKTLELREPDIALREAKARLPRESQRSSIDYELLKQIPELPPVVRFVLPGDRQITKQSIRIKTLSISRGTAFAEQTILVNGQVVDRYEGGGVNGHRDELEVEVVVDLKPGNNEISVVASTARSQSTQSMSISYENESGASLAESGEELPRLAILAVGVGEYSDETLRLKYADDDAISITERFKEQEGRTFSKVATRVLVNSEATRRSVLTGLDWLKEQTPRTGDIRLLFLSGHGMVDKDMNDYFFLSPKYYPNVPLNLDNLNWLVLIKSLTQGGATAILMVDSCHASAISGSSSQHSPINFTNVLRENNANATNLITFAASTAFEYSTESDKWQNGVFTEGILRGLAPGGADGFIGGHRDGVVTVSELKAFVNSWVRTETGGAQNPITILSPGHEHLEIFRLR